MTFVANAPKYFVVALLGAGVAVTVWQLLAPAEKPKTYIVDVREAELSFAGREGKALFDTNCAPCHGLKAAGTDRGPPLVHDIYNPGHHADAAFLFAAQNGVRQHHWSYGNMPPQPQVSAQQIMSVVQYVRELQVANGIRYRSHRM